MKLISWNLAGRSKRVVEQVDALSRRQPDVVALQEVTTHSAPLLRRHLERVGLPYAVNGFDQVSTEARPRKYRQLVASRYPVRPNGCTIPVPWPEAVLAVEFISPWGPIDLFDCHIPPGSSYGWVKVETFEGLSKFLGTVADRPRILCGDFNTPQEERADGTVITWGQRILKDRSVAIRQLIRGKAGARWDAAERSVLTGLAKHDLADVFRQLHGFSLAEFSWRMYRKGTVLDRRFDHVFASAALNPVASQYLHEAGKAELSDHAAIEVVFEPG